jgi:dTDP-4-dehydrorhamnose 3,5-epimerase-like enzyme
MLIDKIKIIPRRLLFDDRGWFLKVITGKEEGLPPYTGEVYFTMGKPGQVKGEHYHPIANEWFTVIAGESKLILEDVKTLERLELSLCFEDAQTIMIPHGIAHAFMNTGNQELLVVAYTDQLYVPEDTVAYKLI